MLIFVPNIINHFNNSEVPVLVISHAVHKHNRTLGQCNSKNLTASYSISNISFAQRSSFCGFHSVMVWLWPAKKALHGRPSPCRGAEENGKKEAETGGSG